MPDLSPRVLDVRIKELDRRLNLHVKYSEKAVDKAQSELRERLAGMNEFREALKDQSSQMVTRSELDAKLEPIDKAVSRHQNTLSSWQGSIWAAGIIIATLSTLVSSAVSYMIAAVSR